MPSPELIKEAERQLTVCNACRYCEGYCAVFPAMELRRGFAAGDVIYLANLCFDCRACYYACPYAPPHEFAVNIPSVLSALRADTYADYTGPRVLARLLGGKSFLVLLMVAVVVALVSSSVLFVQGSKTLFHSGAGEGAFYRVVPYVAMVVPGLVLSAYWLAALAAGAVRFWRSTRGSLAELLDLGAFLRATKDAFGLAYLGGGGEGCAYPGPRPSHSRRWFHHMVFGGVLLDLASTAVAALYHNFLGREAPYAYLSAPVVLGAAGGVLIVAGVFGLLWLKRSADRGPAEPRMLTLDVAFLVLLFLTSFSGLLLLGLRQTSAMGTLLTIHLGIVAGLYLALPYGKFAHAVYRYAALVRYQLETKEGAGALKQGG